MHGLLVVFLASAVLLGALLVVACVVPPPLSLDQPDAGPNAPPIIVAASDTAAQPLRPPGTVTVNVLDTTGELSFQLYDVDVADTLYVRLYVDYDPAAPLGARSECHAEPSVEQSTTRTAACRSAPLCLESDVGSTHRLEADVSDRDVVEGSVSHRDVEPPGLVSTWTLDLVCVSVQP
ncbi:MAG: hypothetical protein H6708_26375 [Kofleriaceae bacterium]|nr:hypothetical protein [Myxococcales bacterium]MCB9563938.1 hypothetical protein [Kofleriaceae bacterium]